MKGADRVQSKAKNQRGKRQRERRGGTTTAQRGYEMSDFGSK